MTTTATCKQVIRSETITGHDEHGCPCRTAITIRVNPKWSEANADTEWFYLCEATETDSTSSGVAALPSLFDEAEDAHAWVDAVVAETEERYAGLEDDRRESLADALAIMAGDEAIPGSPEAELLAAVARAVKAGKAADLIAKLQK